MTVFALSGLDGCEAGLSMSPEMGLELFGALVGLTITRTLDEPSSSIEQ
ncbi:MULTISPECIES: hypothetical protein [unclassified Variovorax]|nr:MULTISPECIES: hypothetical protein [unclassified Variovorax]